MNAKLKKISEWALGGIMAMSLIFLIAFENSEQKSKRCISLKVELNDQNDQFFITPDDIEKYVTQIGSKPLEGKLLSKIDLTELEKRVLEIKQVQECEAFGDLQGNIILKVKPFVPFARILGESGSKDKYMDKNGVLFPLSKYHSERVLLLSGSYFARIKNLSDEKTSELLKLIKTLRNDEFWNSQITQLDIDITGNIKMITLMGEQVIEFGTAENQENKLKKLDIFYRQIMATDQWNKFSKVNVSFANQIVCE